MNDQQFERDTEALRHRGYVSFVEAVRARDTAQREALAQLQAEMPDLRANMTKALDLLQVLTSTKYTDRAFVEAVDEADEMLEQLRGKVVLKGLADQQDAQEVGPLKGEFAEAAEQAFREQYGLQEAQGEPVAWQWRSRIKGGAWEAWENGRYKFEPAPFMDVEHRALYAAPPAAALGDEADRDEAQLQCLRDLYESGYNDGQNNPNGYSSIAEREYAAQHTLRDMRAQAAGGAQHA